jgi:hypothetical protein
MLRKSENESTKCVVVIPAEIHQWICRYITAYKKKWYVEDVNRNNCRWQAPAKLKDVGKPYILVNVIALMGLPVFRRLVESMEAENAAKAEVKEEVII